MNKFIYKSLLSIELALPTNYGKNNFSFFELFNNKYQNNNVDNRLDNIISLV